MCVYEIYDTQYGVFEMYRKYRVTEGLTSEYTFWNYNADKALLTSKSPKNYRVLNYTNVNISSPFGSSIPFLKNYYFVQYFGICTCIVVAD
jgi:hypothetical protein